MYLRLVYLERTDPKGAVRRRYVAARARIDCTSRSDTKRCHVHEDRSDLFESHHECLREMAKVTVRSESCRERQFVVPSDKIQPPLNILPIYIDLASCVLRPEYVSIYVKYCYLDALVLLIQTCLDWTPGRFARLFCSTGENAR